ncbi:hypothetical protein QUB80_33040, partial [Chlorogloeopsis sp. ULAP01]|uniref:hypothetical protein n=1 Tax=Chlorogloeopsis sp. ULAP01 TaxID=3056483 RepID=UPI0025AAB69B
IPFHFLSDSYSTPPNLPLLRGGAVGGGVHPYQPFREIVSLSIEEQACLISPVMKRRVVAIMREGDRQA